MKEEREIFRCKECGYCCHGQTTVSLNQDDLERMAAHLKMPPDQLKKRYLREKNGVIQMKITDGHCIFYNGGCTIHAGKPWRCSQWPLHPSILEDRTNFETIKESCPGIVKNLNYEAFCQSLSRLQSLSEK